MRRLSRTSMIIAAVAVFSTGWTWHRSAAAGELVTQTHGGREVLVYVPSTMPSVGTRALVVVLHGGLGNAMRIAQRRSESALNLDAVAEQGGFVVAYVNGTPVTRVGTQALGWNAGGGCCGQSFARNVDDVGYLGGAIDDLARRYGIDRTRVYGIGHSNGAMMAQRMICESTSLAAAVAISGPLTWPTQVCHAARGRRVLAIHGADDENVPVVGGVGAKGLSRLNYPSEVASQRILEASGATYTLQVVPATGHALSAIDAAIRTSEGIDIPTKAAAFFGLVGTRP